MTQHTKEPWKVRELFNDDEVIDCFVEGPQEAGMPYCAEILGDDYTGFGDLERKRKDAARIVACVNACAGIPDPAAFRDLVEAAKNLLEATNPLIDDPSRLHKARKAVSDLLGIK